MSDRLPGLLVPKAEIRQDHALRSGARGARKLVVTTLFSSKEQEASNINWSRPIDGAKCSVQVMDDTEVAVFNQSAKQDRHFHKVGTEMYMVIDGKMVIELENQDYELSEGDMMIVNPGAVHCVKPKGTEFLCRVVTVHCGGETDKFVV